MAPLPLVLVALLATSAPDPAAALSGVCFDFRQKVVAPLNAPIALTPGKDHHVSGTLPSGRYWASGRVILDMPIQTAYGALLDHRNVKNMAKTTLKTEVFHHPDYLAMHRVDVLVRLRALFVKFNLEWTEAWAYSLAQGTPQAPERIVVSYQKIAGSAHIKRQCGSYVLQAREDGTTDLGLYEEVEARRRNAEDTKNMHVGIVGNIRRWAAARAAHAR